MSPRLEATIAKDATLVDESKSTPLNVRAQWSAEYEVDYDVDDELEFMKCKKLHWRQVY